MNSRTLTRTTGALLVVQALLLFVPVAILGSAINWPASLSEPPSVVLPLIQAQACWPQRRSSAASWSSSGSTLAP